MTFLARNFSRTAYFGCLTPVVFSLLGSGDVFSAHGAQSRSLVRALAWIWLALPAEFEIVLDRRGPGHAASFAIMCAVLLIWPVIFGVDSVRQYAKQQVIVLSVVPHEALIFGIFAICAIGLHLLDLTKVESPIYGFRAHNFGLFYFMQTLRFSLVAITVGSVIFLIGKAGVDRLQRLINT